MNNKLIENVKGRILAQKKRLNQITAREVRGCLEVWAKRACFYCGFYVSVGTFFLLHMLVFISFTWERSQPLNAGANLGYTNYPNNPFHFSSNPSTLRLRLSNGTLETDAAYDISGVSEVVNSTDAHTCSCTGEDWRQSRRKCVLVQLNKVALWQPQLVDLSLAFEKFLPISCRVSSDQYSIAVSPCSPGLPLSLNNTNGRSFPFQSQRDYQRPQLAVQMDFANLTRTAEIGSKLELTLSCSVGACKGVNSIHCPIPLQLPIKIRT